MNFLSFFLKFRWLKKSHVNRERIDPWNFDDDLKIRCGWSESLANWYIYISRWLNLRLSAIRLPRGSEITTQMMSKFSLYFLYIELYSIRRFSTIKSYLLYFSKFSFPNCQNFPFQTVKISLFKLSKFPFPNCQNFLFQTVKNFLFQTVKISFFKLSKFPFPNCQNFLFQTVKISFSKLSKFPFPNCQNFPFQTVKIFLSKPSKFSFPNCQNFREFSDNGLEHSSALFLINLISEKAPQISSFRKIYFN